MPTQTDTIGRLAPGSRVAVLRLRSLGDCVLCTPALELLREFRPDLEVAVVVEDRFREIFPKTLPPSLRALRAFAPDLCLNLHGGSRSARLTLLSGARFRAGFEIFKPGWIYNTPIPTAQQVLGITRRVHTAEHQAAAMFHLGVPVREVPRAVLRPKQGKAPQAPDSAYAVLHAAAATREKTWPAANFVQLARHIRAESGLEPVFIGGSEDDLSACGDFHVVKGAPLGEVMRLLRDASLFVGNDSGPAHVAAAFGTPQLVLFGPSDEEIWHPWRTRHEVLKAVPIQSLAFDHARAAVDSLLPAIRPAALPSGLCPT